VTFAIYIRNEEEYPRQKNEYITANVYKIWYGNTGTSFRWTSTSGTS